MTDNQVMSSGAAYAFTLLNQWEDLNQLSIDFRTQYLNYCQNLPITTEDRKILSLYVAKLSRMWLELYPKLKGRTDIESSKEFLEYQENIIESPEYFLSHGASKLLNLELAIRQALEDLKITKFEDTRT